MSHSETPWTAACKIPCPSLSPQVCSNSCPLSQWCHPTILSSVVPFSSCLQSFPVSGSFLMSQFMVSGSQSIGASASASVLLVGVGEKKWMYNNIWCPVLCLVTQSCPTLCDPMDCSLPDSFAHGHSLGKNSGVNSLSLLQGIFLTQESHRGLLHCRQILYQLSYPGSPNTGVGCHALLQGIFPAQGSNPGLPHCRQTL